MSNPYVVSLSEPGTMYLVVETFNEYGDPDATYHGVHATRPAAELAVAALLKKIYDDQEISEDESFETWLSHSRKFLGVGKKNGWTTWELDECFEFQIIPVKVLNS